MVENLAAFFVVAAVVIVTPGPDTALTIRNTLLGGRRGGVFSAVGVAAGQAAWTIATSAGIATLLVASEVVFQAVKLVGAAYLALLGLQAVYAAVRHRSTGDAGVASASGRRLRAPVAFRHGLISNLTNPKMAVFFPALLPQFAPEGELTFLVLLLLGGTFALMTLIWLTGYAFAVARAGDFLRRPQVRRVLEATTGAVLIALGVRLATAER